MTKFSVKHSSKIFYDTIKSISDCFIVINKNNLVIEYNDNCKKLFSNNNVTFNINYNILEFFKIFDAFDVKIFEENLSISIKNRKNSSYNLECNEILGYKTLKIEFLPIIIKGKNSGVVITFKDITQLKKNIIKIEEQSKILIKKKKLASLGSLISGISHNLKTPILGIKGCIVNIKELSDEFSKSICNKLVTKVDYTEILKEMEDWLDDIKNQHKYIFDSLNIIKDQTSKNEVFTIRDVISNIDFLMKYELNLNECILLWKIDIEEQAYILGNKGVFIQVINNIISNSIQAYKNKNLEIKKIELNIYKMDKYIYFKITDYAGGISKSVKNKLFKEIVTSKDKDGTGIGLFLSYSRINDMFKGEMWYESDIGIGTTFYIKIPIGE